MRIGLYGMPTAGKTHILNKIDFIEVANGSRLLREYADEQAVQKMKREQQQKIKPDFRRNQSTKEKQRDDWER